VSVVMKVVFSLSLSGSLLILILLLCRPLFRERLSRQWQYYIWLVVIARLILPVAPQTSVVGTAFANMDRPEQAAQTADPGTMHGSEQVSAQKETLVVRYQRSGENGSGGSVRGISTGGLGGRLLQNLWILWFGAALFLLLRRITLYQFFAKYIRIGHGEVSDPALLDRLAQIGEGVGVSRPVELYVNSQVPSPLLIGFFRPCIVLPTADLSADDFSYTVRHELMHYKRKDMFYKWLVQLTVCLHWFNPLVWLMSREINRACEFSCDEAVIRPLGEEGRRAYGDTLFRAMAAGGSDKGVPVSVALNESVELMKERLCAIMKFRKSSRLVTTVSVVLAAAMTMGATVMGAYVEPVGTPGSAWSAPTGLKHAGGQRYSGTDQDADPAGKYAGSADVADQQVTDQNGGKSEFKNGLFGDRYSEENANFLEELAGQYYEEDRVSQFGAVFSAMDASAQKRWLDKLYADDAVSFFFTAVDSLEGNSPLIGEYVERSYVDDEISFFSGLMSNLDRDSPLIENYAERAYADDRISYFAVLTDEMSADLLKSWQDKAAKGDMDINFQSVLTGSDDLTAWKQNAEQEDKKQYQEWGIVRNGGHFYYQDQPVRVFFDQYEGEQVIRTLNWNPAGTVDVKVTRSIRNKIISVAYMTEEEVTELFDTEEEAAALFGTEELPGLDPEEEAEETKEEKHEAGKKEMDKGEFDPDDVYRLTAEELPEEVAAQMMDDGAIREWYVYHADGRQYLCYRGFAWSYGYRLQYDENGWQVDIQRFRKKDAGDVFLDLPDNGPVTVYCDGEKVTLKDVDLFGF
jgi:beta-lactamase regulating signal transducer with metallopeptidase domain